MSTDEYEDKYNYDMYAGYQIQHLNEDFERLRPSQFETEDAYRAALIEQYRGIREAEYRAVCYNKGLEMYKDSMFNPIAQYEQAYSYYKYLCMQMDYKIKCKEYEKMCKEGIPK